MTLNFVARHNEVASSQLSHLPEKYYLYPTEGSEWSISIVGGMLQEGISLVVQNAFLFYLMKTFMSKSS